MPLLALPESERISIHAPRERSDASAENAMYLLSISIHAPRERSDMSITSRASVRSYFNPRSS